MSKENEGTYLPPVGERFREVIRTIEMMRDEGVISEYAVGGAIAFITWDQPVATGDVDVLVLIAEEANVLDPLRTIFNWLNAHDIKLDGPYALVAGVAVQFLIAWNPLAIEGVREAAIVPYEGATLRVLRPAYLVAIWRDDPSAYTFLRHERAARLLDAGIVTNEEIDTLIKRHGR